MRKIIIVLLFTVNSVFAQTSIPSSGAVSMSQIATVMKNLGEITSGELATSYSLSFLNGKSHLVDKTAPFKVSDWYGYAAMEGGGPGTMRNGTIGASPCGFVVGAYTWGIWWDGDHPLTPLLGNTIYTDAARTIVFTGHPGQPGSFSVTTPGRSDEFYVFTINSSGVVTAVQGGCGL